MDKVCKEYLNNHDVDAIGVGIIDFNSKAFVSKTYQKHDGVIVDNSKIYFDLASLTKVLTNGFFYLDHIKQMDSKDRLLIEHRAGLPAWGLLSKNSWRDEILSYPITESQTLYSDYSALRFMLEVEKKLGCNFKEEVSKFYDCELKFWKELDTLDETLQNGYEKGLANFTKVHDPNARNINEFTSHAGLFATVDGLCKTLLKAEDKLKFINTVQSNITDNRFVLGWDRVENPQKSTAGVGCSDSTFGHLGFTGTSVWIDPRLRKCILILSNTTKHFWHDRYDLNNFRKKLGEIAWTQKKLSLDSYFY